MTTKYIVIVMIIMALVSYLPRMLPLVIFRKKIRNVYIRSILEYMPFGILAAMVFPDVLYSTGGIVSAILGMLTAFIMSHKKFGLFPVAASATAVVFLCEQVIKLF